MSWNRKVRNLVAIPAPTGSNTHTCVALREQRTQVLVTVQPTWVSLRIPTPRIVECSVG
jgi:hypothetical protein